MGFVTNSLHKTKYRQVRIALMKFTIVQQTLQNETSTEF